jgi:hypothetical protein
MKLYLAIIALALTGCATSPQEKFASTNAPSAFPNESLADTILTRDTVSNLKIFENAFHLNGEPGISSFGSPKVIGKKIIQRTDAQGIWREEWTVQRKGYTVIYMLKFVRSAQGGTDIVITPPKK